MEGARGLIEGNDIFNNDQVIRRISLSGTMRNSLLAWPVLVLLHRHPNP